MFKYCLFLLFFLTSCSYSPNQPSFGELPILSIEMGVVDEDAPIQVIEPEIPLWEAEFTEFPPHVVEYTEKWIDLLELRVWKLDYGYSNLGDSYLGMTWKWMEDDGPHAMLRLTLPTTETQIRFALSGGEWQEVIIHELMHMKVYEVLWTAINNPAMLSIIDERFVFLMGQLLRELESRD